MSLHFDSTLYHPFKVWLNLFYLQRCFCQVQNVNNKRLLMCHNDSIFVKTQIIFFHHVYVTVALPLLVWHNEFYFACININFNIFSVWLGKVTQFEIYKNVNIKDINTYLVHHRHLFLIGFLFEFVSFLFERLDYHIL